MSIDYISPKVSIVIPIYNVEKYLRECIDSVINQSYKNIEIILINDGSPDGCEKICQEYIEKHDNIKYIYQENQGVASARNNGIKNATGDYVYILDSDDYIDRNFIESSVKNAEEHNSDIVIVATNIVKRPHEINCNLGGCTCWELFIKREYLNKYPDIRLPEDMYIHEDFVFSHELLCLTDKVSINYHAFYYYREVQTSIMHSKAKDVSKIWHNKIKCLELLDKFHTKYSDRNIKKSIIYDAFFRLFIVQYWTYKFDTKQRQILFEKSHEFIKKHKLGVYKFKTNKKKFLLANIFILCKKWWQYEIVLFIINTYIFFTKPFAKKNTYHNA